MKIVLSPRTEKQLRNLPKFDQIAIAEKIRNLPQSQQSGEEKLSGFPGIYRVRVGNYRIVYKKLADSFYIVIIRHRRDVYRLVKDLLG
ncbi:hypothetical protein A3J20_03115 [Candidatus Gottesmanbacteria bacterium RIFCSPLOWO2_02_FULL_42_29]|uniref:Plasmid stabilization protein n=1 Tax=Candidatus Gottesmanbacteria bacterium RIFCSPLOWO2_01_FULL_42_22 TaxID=1798391 RepID=A0A1F6B7S9_9BACT|nr:MAG: Plasmid stabilization system [Candidatus Gottesmanbacteria bacterium GW2011_GWC2_42_8]OGG10855.1 MAG: hypothetical protein A2781_02010 [Candidatus Gottesmanbacteria bacterium RIFCSPHIGHO2_01_FULL_42_27]OGG19186.1 MAG: hypothetical protein A3E72_00280 [Candidatus Gottesmanbacteria bacterium RIFCSPHIGHO2_12_FULL_43_26]OGG32948.1 MAG: hypothetical protein A2968_06800 [Candidatus Gottesmanbacteria bacterium RIFCSPLOWO2_01_FULL_42_22]OGG34786.1 MAG: hypothetical protein A3G68_06405 [Candidat